MRNLPQISLANKLSPGDITKIAQLHKKLLWESILNEFGPVFLKELYLSILKDKNNILILAKKDGKIIGYLVATKDKYQFYKNIIKNGSARFFFTTIKILFIKPLLPIKFIYWWFFSRKIYLPKAELQFIAIDHQFQGIGLGSKMLELLKKVYAKDHIHIFCVGTKSQNVESNRFYVRKKFELVYSGLVLGDEFNYYTWKQPKNLRRN